MRARARLEVLVRDYANADPSDTFVSYNDAIVLARAVRELWRKLAAKQDRISLLEKANRIGWDTRRGERLRTRAKALKGRHARKDCPYLHVKKCRGCGRSCSCYSPRRDD